jgi:hypothetical protein
MRSDFLPPVANLPCAVLQHLLLTFFLQQHQELPGRFR